MCLTRNKILLVSTYFLRILKVQLRAYLRIHCFIRPHFLISRLTYTYTIKLAKSEQRFTEQAAVIARNNKNENKPPRARIHI